METQDSLNLSLSVSPPSYPFFNCATISFNFFLSLYYSPFFELYISLPFLNYYYLSPHYSPFRLFLFVSFSLFLYLSHVLTFSFSLSLSPVPPSLSLILSLPFSLHPSLCISTTPN